ncbi:MAG: hypothetical protein M1829_004748 [Trizodia sp. TS-e1964]|nr:MAG: hypothetical protein M1829_004748 [Trizodia sp. TS-e1964]
MSFARRGQQFLSLLLFVYALYIPSASSCGVLVHNEVARRSQFLVSSSDFAALIADPQSLQAGAFFPDWGYKCFQTDDDAEIAHWPPFIKAAVEYIQETYPIWSDAVSLIAFLFGITAHDSADATWHSLHLQSGLLDLLAAADFGGNVGDAHTALDTGGDFVFATRWQETGSAWLSSEWKVPLADLVKIYKRLGRDVNEYTLRYCVMRGLALVRGSLVLGPQLSPKFSPKTMIDRLDDYYLGGIDEMSARAAGCWHGLFDWLETTPSTDPWDLCDVFQAIRGNTYSKPHKRRGGHSAAIQEFADNAVEHVVVSSDAQGVERYTLSPSNDLNRIEFDSIAFLLSNRSKPPVSFPAQHGSPVDQVPLRDKTSPKEGLLPGFESGLQKPSYGADPIYLATYAGYSQFGQSITVGSFDPTAPNELQAVIGAPLESEDSRKPHAGSIYLMPLRDIPASSEASIDLKSGASGSVKAIKSSPSEDHIIDARFGTSSVGWTLGDQSYVVSSSPGPQIYHGPGAPPGTAVSGKVEVFSGSQILFDVKLLGAQLGRSGHRQFGSSMLTADLNGDGLQELLVASKYSDGWRFDGCGFKGESQAGEGFIMIIQANASEINNLLTTITTHGISVLINEGSAIPINNTTTGPHLHLSVLSLPPSEKAKEPCMTTSYDWFGDSMAYLPPNLLLVGAPGRNKVFVFEFPRGTLEPSLIHTIPGPIANSSFGANSIASGVVAGQTWIAIAAPNEEVEGQVQAGVVRLYVVLKGDAFGVQLIAELAAAPVEAFGKFGMTLRASTDLLYIGSAYSHKERGAVWLVDVGEIIGASSTGSHRRLQVRNFLKGAEAKAHFGHSLAVADIRGTGRRDLLVGVPFAGVTSEEEGGQYHGAVAVFWDKS